MRNAVVDQILLWIVLFITFVTLFFTVIDYYIVMKTKERVDSLSSYGARMEALGRDESTIVEGLNNIIGSTFVTVTQDDLNCTDLGTTNYQVVFTVRVGIKNRFISADKKLISISSFFNEVNSSDYSCILDLNTTN